MIIIIFCIAECVASRHRAVAVEGPNGRYQVGCNCVRVEYWLDEV